MRNHLSSAIKKRNVRNRGEVAKTASARRVYAERKTRSVCQRHELRALAPFGRSRRSALLGAHEGTVDEALGEVQSTVPS